MAYTDKTLTCVECGGSYTFAASEQELFAQRGYTNEPKRCPACREARRSQRDGGFGRPQREMYPATCAQCGAQTQVPFRPRGDRPVYCSDCFAKQRGTTGSSSSSSGMRR